MNIREELLKEKTHSKTAADKITVYACSSPTHFKQLMDCFLSNEYRLAQRAAWSVSWAARAKPQLITPYIGSLVAQLTRTDVHDAVIRNSVRVLEAIEIPERYHGEIMNVCFALIEKPTTPAAIKAFSLTTLYNLGRHYPEIMPELNLLIETLWHAETPAFKSRGKKILQAIAKTNDTH
jgi:hypothetical protein